MRNLTTQQAAEKAFQAEVILYLIQEKTVTRMEDCEIESLLLLVKELIGGVGGFLCEEASREEEKNV